MKHLLSSALGRFRLISLAEGISYILLLVIAMPMKYVGQDPSMVKLLGPIHGFLFIVFMAGLLNAAFDRDWKYSRMAIAFIASILPLGAFFLELSLKKEMAAIQEDVSA